MNSVLRRKRTIDELENQEVVAALEVLKTFNLLAKVLKQELKTQDLRKVKEAQGSNRWSKHDGELQNSFAL